MGRARKTDIRTCTSPTTEPGNLGEPRLALTVRL